MFSGKFPRRVMKGETRVGESRGEWGGLKQLAPWGFWGRAFFSSFSNFLRCVASLSKQLFYVIISGALLSSTTWPRIKHSAMSQPLATYAARLTRFSARLTPSTPLLQCRKSVTQIEQCTSLLKYLIRSTTVSRPISATSSSMHTHRQTSSTAYASYNTVVTQNPRVDEDGKDMTIEISPRAAKVC
jgi:hypothetical protein